MSSVPPQSRLCPSLAPFPPRNVPAGTLQLMEGVDVAPTQQSLLVFGVSCTPKAAPCSSLGAEGARAALLQHPACLERGQSPS